MAKIKLDMRDTEWTQDEIEAVIANLKLIAEDTVLRNYQQLTLKERDIMRRLIKYNQGVLQKYGRGRWWYPDFSGEYYTNQAHDVIRIDPEAEFEVLSSMVPIYPDPVPVPVPMPKNILCMPATRQVDADYALQIVYVGDAFELTDQGRSRLAEVEEQTKTKMLFIHMPELSKTRQTPFTFQKLSAEDQEKLIKANEAWMPRVETLNPCDTCQASKALAEADAKIKELEKKIADDEEYDRKHPDLC